MKYNLDLLTIQDFPKEFQSVVYLIGSELAYKLCRELGGYNLYIPKADKVDARLRNLSIIEDFKGGLNYNDIAKKYNLSHSQVRSICSISNLR